MDLKSSLKTQKSLVRKFNDPSTIRRILAHRLMYRESTFALAMLYFAVDPNSYVPKKGEKFENWNWPVTEIEWDLGGVLRMLPNNEFLYEGGECKSSNTRISSAQCVADKHRNLRCGISIEETNQTGRWSNELGFRVALSLFDESVSCHRSQTHIPNVKGKCHYTLCAAMTRNRRISSFTARTSSG